MELTERQIKILKYVQTYMVRKGSSPTLDQICQEFGIKTRAGANVHIKALIKKGFLEREGRNLTLSEPDTLGDILTLPLAGTIAAGKPIETVPLPDSIEVPKSFLEKGADYCLKVTGQSMVDDGILDGDIVAIKKQASATNGQIVVAVLNQQATLKRFFQKKGQIELHPANSMMTPLIITPDSGEFMIMGTLIGVLRVYA